MSPERIHPVLRWIPIAGMLFAASAVAQTTPPMARYPDEAPFLAANDAAMRRMMDDMAVKPTGDVDVDFTAMMIPHHQGALDMAQAELRWGCNEQLRRIAQEIIVDQQQEITAMRIAVGQPLPPAVPAPTGGSPPTPGGHSSKTSPMDQAR